MIDLIINKIIDEIKAGMGENSDYEDDLVTNVQAELPKTITTETFIGVIPGGPMLPIGKELGQKLSTQNQYSVDVIIFVKDSSQANGIQRMTKLVNRFRKVLAESQLLTLQYTDGTIQESPYDFSLDKIEYDTAGADKVFANGAVVGISVKTQFKY